MEKEKESEYDWRIENEKLFSSSEYISLQVNSLVGHLNINQNS